MILFPMRQISAKIPNIEGKNGSDEDFGIVSFETANRISVLVLRTSESFLKFAWEKVLTDSQDISISILEQSKMPMPRP